MNMYSEIDSPANIERNMEGGMRDAERYMNSREEMRQDLMRKKATIDKALIDFHACREVPDIDMRISDRKDRRGTASMRSILEDEKAMIKSQEKDMQRKEMIRKRKRGMTYMEKIHVRENMLLKIAEEREALRLVEKEYDEFWKNIEPDEEGN